MTKRRPWPDSAAYDRDMAADYYNDIIDEVEDLTALISDGEFTRADIALSIAKIATCANKGIRHLERQGAQTQPRPRRD